VVHAVCAESDPARDLSDTCSDTCSPYDDGLGLPETGEHGATLWPLVHAVRAHCATCCSLGAWPFFVPVAVLVPQKLDLLETE